MFRSKFCNGNYFYELPILSDVVLDYRIVEFVWTFVESWHYSVLNAVFVKKYAKFCMFKETCFEL